MQQLIFFQNKIETLCHKIQQTQKGETSLFNVFSLSLFILTCVVAGQETHPSDRPTDSRPPGR